MPIDYLYFKVLIFKPYFRKKNIYVIFLTKTSSAFFLIRSMSKMSKSRQFGSLFFQRYFKATLVTFCWRLF